MVPTPRTDAVQKACYELGWGSAVAVPDGYPPCDPWELARQLERELADMNRLREEQQYLAITRGEALEKVRKDLLALEKRMDEECDCYGV